MKGNYFIAISLLILIALPLTSCKTNKSYNPAYGFADANPTAYNNDLSMCRQEAMRVYPAISPPQLQPLPDCSQARGITLAGMCGSQQAAVSRMNEQAMNEYKRYNDSRSMAINSCMSQRGWRIVTVEE
ncbi:hypothetical protein [Pseudodesulfovibrio methanolicus]|uniref:Lipoprotein n=1 Tax=Pseudodesulfovibrio methanolicus TaxID=3126690 RepID=A0ABZ2IZP7_9BACT